MVHSLVVVQVEEQPSQRENWSLHLWLSAVVGLCWEKLKTYREVYTDTIRFHNEVILIELFLSLRTIFKCTSLHSWHKPMEISEMQSNNQRHQSAHVHRPTSRKVDGVWKRAVCENIPLFHWTNWQLDCKMNCCWLKDNDKSMFNDMEIKDHSKC